MWRLPLDAVKYVLVWRVGLKQLFMQVYLYNKDTEGILQCSKCVHQHKQKTNLHNMSFIGPALLTILANIFCYLCTWTSKQMVLQFLDILGIGHLLEPLESVIQEKFIPAILEWPSSSRIECLPSWHSQEDGRVGADNMFLYCWILLWGIKQQLQQPQLPTKYLTLWLLASKQKLSRYLSEIQNAKLNLLKQKEIFNKLPPFQQLCWSVPD